MQCIVETVYRNVAIGLSRSRSRRLDVAMSSIRKTPSGRSAAPIARSTRRGAAWSWMASNAVIKSNADGDVDTRGVLRSESCILQPCPSASAPASATASRTCRSRRTGCAGTGAPSSEPPRPRRSRRPRRRFRVSSCSTRPGASGRVRFGSVPYDRCAAGLGHQLVESFERRVRNAAAVTEAVDDRRLRPPEHRHHLVELGEILRSGAARQHRRVLRWQLVGSRRASYSTMRPATIAPSHSRT